MIALKTKTPHHTPHHTTMKNIHLTAVIFGICAAIFISLFFITYYVIIPTDKHQYEKKYQKTQLTVEKMWTNPYRCCVVRGCVCEETNAPTCSSFVASLFAGECNTGYHCCREHCDTCRYKACDDCIETTRDCRCRCVSSVDHYKCNSYCSSCYKPTIMFNYIPTDAERQAWETG